MAEKAKDAYGGKLDDWRRRWHAAAAAPDAATVASLTADLNGLALPEEEIEIEREMLDGLDQLVQLQAALGRQRIARRRDRSPRGRHRDLPLQRAIVHARRRGAQPSGRLIFTGARAIFAGGARALTLPWHTVADVVQQERDVILVRHDRETFHRFRCNVFADALCAGLLARTLARRTRSARSGS